MVNGENGCWCTLLGTAQSSWLNLIKWPANRLTPWIYCSGSPLRIASVASNDHASEMPSMALGKSQICNESSPRFLELNQIFAVQYCLECFVSRRIVAPAA